jgi:hypothetical protein
LSDEKRSTQRIGFIEKNRSYVINYNLGQDMVQEYVERLVAQATQATQAAKPGVSCDQQQLRWQIFADLLSYPKTASMLKQ